MAVPILAGIDESTASLEAMRWAAEEARLRQWPLRLIHALPRWAGHMAVDAPHGEVGVWMRKCADDLLDQSMATARQIVRGVSGAVLAGDPREVLLEQARRAEMVVVGGHGLGRIRGVMVGSVGLGLAGRTSCPLVVVREVPVDGEVVVGVDGSPASVAAVAFAFQAASVRGVRLRAVHSWIHPVAEYPGDWLPPVFDIGDVEREEARVLAEGLAGYPERYPDVPVIPQVVRRHPVTALRAASAGAGLLVVGSRGRGGFTELVLGSVSHAMLHQARCPVAVATPGL